MTVTALVSVAPVREGSMAEPVARALEAIEATGISYEINPMGTVIEADDIDDILGAVAAAHAAVEGDRVSTFVKIDDKRTSSDPAQSKVDRVMAELESTPD